MWLATAAAEEEGEAGISGLEIGAPILYAALPVAYGLVKIKEPGGCAD